MPRSDGRPTAEFDIGAEASRWINVDRLCHSYCELKPATLEVHHLKLKRVS